MAKRSFLILFFALLLLSGCAKKDAAAALPLSTPEPSFEPSPEPTVEPTPEAVELSIETPEPQREKVYNLPRIVFSGSNNIWRQIYEGVSVEVYDEYGTLVFSDDSAQWRTRGNTTARTAKRPINVKFSQSVDLFGLGRGKKFCLLANSYDKTLIRNELALGLADSMELLNVSNRCYVEVYCEDGFYGNYLLITPVSMNSPTVHLHEADGDMIFELHRNRPPTKPYICTKYYNQTLQLDCDSIDTPQFLEYVSFFDNFELALQTGDKEKIAEYIDIDSFVDTYILYEVTKNSDVFESSTRWYLRKGKLYSGPPWDYDLSFGNFCAPVPPYHIRSNGTYPTYTDGWYAVFGWFKALANMPWFEELFVERYLELSPTIENLYMDNELGQNRIDSIIASISESIEANFERWDITDYVYTTQRYPDPTYEENLAYLRTWIQGRHEWILSEINHGGDIIKIK